MRKIKIFFFISVLSVAYFPTVQGRVRVNVNFNLQPQWGPASNDYVEYYFLPELGIYYSVPTHEFICPNGNRWMFSRKLPPRYRHFNLNSTYKVVINDPNPYLRNDYYMEHYRGYRIMHQDDQRDFKRDNGRHKGWEHYGNAHDNEDGYGHGHAEHRGRGRDHD